MKALFIVLTVLSGLLLTGSGALAIIGTYLKDWETGSGINVKLCLIVALIALILFVIGLIAIRWIK